MRTITITITDELGNVTNDPQKNTYQLDLETEGFDSIEKAVINFKNQMLPDLQKQILEEEQEKFIKKKPDSLRCNGTALITIKTLNGSFPFKNQRFIENNCDQTSHTYLGLTGQFENGHISEGLKEFSAYYANRLSYFDTEELVERTTGEKQFSGQSVDNIVVTKALEVSKQVASEASTTLEEEGLTLPEINQRVDVYDAEAKETLILADGIGVKKQSESRVSSKSARFKTEKNTKNTKSRVNTNIVLLEKKTGNFEYITSAIDRKGEELLPFSDIVKSKVIREYGNDEEPLNVVAISDGAKDIRSMLMAVFGVLIVIILDWYHLRKKVLEFMSMIARNKLEKAEHLEFLLYHLWHGQTQEVLDYLNTKVKAKNEEKLQELIGYIEKHKEEIIDYDRRKKAGKEVGLEPEQEDDEVVHSQSSSDSKTVVNLNQEQEAVKARVKTIKKVVGSGRVEKACDSTIGKRQKHKAMSWSKVGSRSLAILKVVELNHRWLDIWFPPIASLNLQRAANDPCEIEELELAA